MRMLVEVPASVELLHIRFLYSMNPVTEEYEIADVNDNYWYEFGGLMPFSQRSFQIYRT